MTTDTEKSEMSASLHQLVYFYLSLAGGLICALAAYLTFGSAETLGKYWVAVSCAAFVIGLVFSMFVVRNCLPARCRKCHQNAAYLRDFLPKGGGYRRLVCRGCGYIYQIG